MPFGAEQIHAAHIKTAIRTINENKVEDLDLGAFFLDDDDMLRIIEALQSNTSIISLALYRNTFSDWSARCVVHWALNSPQVQHIDLENTNISEAASREIYAALVECSHIKSFYLPHFGKYEKAVMSCCL